MRTIHRDVVGGFVFSSDNKVLLGKNRDGGVYEGSYCVPGGGVEDHETKLQALAREMLEETGIDISIGQVEEINLSAGKHEKSLRDTDERVLVKMTFYDFRIDLPNPAEDIEVRAEDDWLQPTWFRPAELFTQSVSDPTAATLRKIGYLAT